MKMQMALACMAAILVAHGDVGRKAEAFRPKERWCGFNLLGMFCQTKMEAGDKRIFGYFPEDRFRWMNEWGSISRGCRSTTGFSSRRATG